MSMFQVWSRLDIFVDKLLTKCRWWLQGTRCRRISHTSLIPKLLGLEKDNLVRGCVLQKLSKGTHQHSRECSKAFLMCLDYLPPWQNQNQSAWVSPSFLGQQGHVDHSDIHQGGGEEGPAHLCWRREGSLVWGLGARCSGRVKTSLRCRSLQLFPLRLKKWDWSKIQREL